MHIWKPFRVSCLLPIHLALSGLLLGLSGCDRTQQGSVATHAEGADSSEGRDGSGRYVSGELSPASTIRDCIRAYKRLSSYADEASVELRYKVDGVVHADTAPLSIAWQKNGPIGLHVYSVRGGPGKGENASRFRLRIERESFAAANQVLSRDIPEQLDFAWLLEDRLVAQNIAAGLGGFPPQLDLLLSEKPMQQLLTPSSQFVFGPSTTIDGRSCHVVNINLGTLTYRLFIDKATMLVRRIRLPSGNLPPELLANEELSDIQLWIDVKQIRVNDAIPWDRFRITPRADELLVNHFVPKPASLEIEQLGSQIPAFELRNSANEIVLDARKRSKKKATVMMWLADHPACRVAAQQLAEIAKTLAEDPELRRQVQFVPIWAEPNAPSGESFESLAQSWNLPGKLAIDRVALGRDLFNINEAPSFVVLDEQGFVQLRETRANPVLDQILPGLLERICTGVNVADELRRKQRNIQLRYQTDLRSALAIDSPPLMNTALGTERMHPSDSSDYDPVDFELREMPPVFLETPVAAATLDSRQQLWLLQANGNLVREGPLGSRGERGSEPVEFPVGWKARAGDRLIIDSEGRYVAFYASGSSEVKLFDTEQRQPQTLRLSGNSSIVDLKWLTIRNQASRLAAITTDSELVLLDPRNQEQLSGRCPSPPLALVAQSRSNSTIGGQVILANRNIEPLRLSEDSTVQSVPGLGKPASFAFSKEQSIKKLSFQPAIGPWVNASLAETSQADGQQLILASGWIAKDEAAFLLLDEQMRPQWHHRTAIQAGGLQKAMTHSAMDPETGNPVWVTMDREQTIHILRSDGLADHFRLPDPPVGLALVPDGSRLNLCVVYADRYQLSPILWK